MKNTKNPHNQDGQKVDKKAKTDTDKGSDTDKTAGKTKTGGDRADAPKAITKAVTVALTKVSGHKGSTKPPSQDELKKWATKQALDDAETEQTDEESLVGDPLQRTFPRSGKLARSPPGSQTPARGVQSESSEAIGEGVDRETNRLRANSVQPLLGDRGNEADSESGDEVFERDCAANREELTAEAMHGIRTRLDGILSDPNAKFSKPVAQRVAALFSEASKLMMQLGCDNAYLRGRLAERAVTSRLPLATFAELAGRGKEPRREANAGAPKVPGIGRVGPRNDDRELTVVVASGSKEIKSDDIKRTLLQVIDPVASNIRIRNVRKARDGRVLIQAHSKFDAEKIIAN